MNPSIVARRWRLLFSDASRSTLELSIIDAFICSKWYAYPSFRFSHSSSKILWCSWNRLMLTRKQGMWINRLVHKTPNWCWHLDIRSNFFPDFSYGKSIFRYDGKFAILGIDDFQQVNVSKLLSAIQQERSASIFFLLTSENKWVIISLRFQLLRLSTWHNEGYSLGSIWRNNKRSEKGWKHSA